jgi:hypothetical protein
MRRLTLSLLILAVLPATAAGDVTLDEFTVTPSSTQAGSHPDVTLFQRMTPSAGDDAKDSFVRLAPGLLGNPQAAALCTREQLHSSSGCPDNTKVGTVQVTALINVLPILGVPQTINGTVYNLRPVGGEPARLGLRLQPLELPAPLPQALPPVFLESPVYLRPGPDGIGLESLFSDQPREQSGLDIQITSVRLTFLGKASRGSFMRMPTSCGPATSLARVNSYGAPGTFAQKTFTFTPTGCDRLAFTPSAEGSLGAPGATRAGDKVPLSTTLRLDPEQAALKRAEVTLPLSLASTTEALNRACRRPEADASACPDSSRVGTATIDSPLQAAPVRGPVYLALNTPAVLPGLMVILPPPVDLRIDGVTETGSFGTRNVFPTNPDLPLRSFTLQFEGGPTGILQLTKDLCRDGTPTEIDVKLTAHSGRVAEFKQDLATPGCDPEARVTLTKRGKRFVLAAILQAPRRGPDITAARLSLPKGLRRGRVRPRVHVDGRRLRTRAARRSVRPKVGDGARRIKIVWRGLRAKRKLPRKVTVPVSMADARGKRITLRLRVRRH